MKIKGTFYLKNSPTIFSETIYVRADEEEEARRSINSLKEKINASFNTGRISGINFGQISIRTSEIAAYKIFEEKE